MVLDGPLTLPAVPPAGVQDAALKIPVPAASCLPPRLRHPGLTGAAACRRAGCGHQDGAPQRRRCAREVPERNRDAQVRVARPQHRAVLRGGRAPGRPPGPGEARAPAVAHHRVHGGAPSAPNSNCYALRMQHCGPRGVSRSPRHDLSTQRLPEPCLWLISQYREVCCMA